MPPEEWFVGPLIMMPDRTAVGQGPNGMTSCRDSLRLLVSTFVDLAAVADAQNEDEDFIVFDGADQTVVPDAIFPEIA